MTWKEILNPIRIKNIDENNTNLNTWSGNFTINENQDIRSEFQKDYDRCLFSTPVRRLQDKAQVFPLEPNDSVRTRLTHSLEVSNIAKSIAERICQQLLEQDLINNEEASEIPVIAMTCGLIHDIGNPPFGHAGEDAMREGFNHIIENTKDKDGNKYLSRINQIADFRNFEGNAQTIRLVTKLQMLADFSGLNLTIGTLSALRKYISRYDTIDKNKCPYKKLGVFASENELIEKVEEITNTHYKRNPITYIVEAADDIVYSIIDIEDGIKKGVLNWELLKYEMKGICDAQINKAEQNIYDRADKQKFDTLDTNTDTKAYHQLNGKALDEAKTMMFRTLLMNDHIKAVVNEFLSNYQEIMQGTYSGELVDNKEMGETLKQSKKIAANHVFNSKDILKLEVMGREVIKDLMYHFWDGIKNSPHKNDDKGFDKKIYQLLSKNYRTVFEHNSQNGDLNIEYYKLQLLGDYICGMTDNFACQIHKSIKNG